MPGQDDEIGFADSDNDTTMFFNNKCGIRHHHDKELLKVTAGE